MFFSKELRIALRKFKNKKEEIYLLKNTSWDKLSTRGAIKQVSKWTEQ